MGHSGIRDRGENLIPPLMRTFGGTTPRRPLCRFPKGYRLVGLTQIDNLEAGMTLACDVNDRAGRLLLGAGVELSQKHLVILRTWGIMEVDIVGVEDDDQGSHLPPEITQEQLDAAMAALAPFFLNTDTNHPVMRELLRLAALRKASHGLS